jgi:hypothetical protein
MFIEILQGILSFLERLWRWVQRLTGLEDDQVNSKRSEWNNPYGLRQEYVQPHFYNAHHGASPTLRQRSSHADVDRNTNQESQSSAVTLPRPFYAPARQSPHLTNRGGVQKQKRSLVDLLLEQQKDASVSGSTEPSEAASSSEQAVGTSVESAAQPSTTAPTEDDYDCSIVFGESLKSAPVSAVYEPPQIAPKFPVNEKSGLRGSVPLVKLNRMRFIAQMAKDGNDGARMGDYAPESVVNSVDIRSIAGILRTESSDASASTIAAAPAEARNSKSQWARSSPYPTLSLKDLSLLSVIGGGGFGQVWKGTWGGTPVAVKLLNNLIIPVGSGPALPEHEQLLTAFEEEVSMLAQLRHPNICLFLGVCLEPPHRAIVTELVSRGSLWDCLRIPNLFQVRGYMFAASIAADDPVISCYRMFHSKRAYPGRSAYYDAYWRARVAGSYTCTATRRQLSTET